MKRSPLTKSLAVFLLGGIVFWAIIFGALLLIARADPLCRLDPLAVYDHDSRYRLIDACYTTSGDVVMTYQESAAEGGNLHVVIAAETGNGDGLTNTEFTDADALPPRPGLFKLTHATITGALVWDSLRERYAIKPAWGLAEIARRYPEQRSDGSIWRVWQWRDGSYSDERVH